MLVGVADGDGVADVVAVADGVGESLAVGSVVVAQPASVAVTRITAIR